MAIFLPEYYAHDGSYVIKIAPWTVDLKILQMEASIIY